MALTRRLYSRGGGHASTSKDLYIGEQGMPTTTVAGGYRSGYENEDRGSRSEPEEGHEREGRAKLYICQVDTSGVKRSSNVLKCSVGLYCARCPVAANRRSIPFSLPLVLLGVSWTASPFGSGTAQKDRDK